MSLFATLGRSLALVGSLLIATSALAQLQPTDAQRQAAVEAAETLRYGHYADINLDDDWSRRAFDRYLDLLDSQRAYLLQDDVDAFRDLQARMDDALLDGDLARPFALYSRYHERAETRLEWLLAKIDAGLDFDLDDNARLQLDREEAPWEEDIEALDELWLKRLKNAALAQQISGQEEAKVEDNLRQRFEGQLTRMRQTEPEDVFGVFMAAVTGSIDPHSDYLSPRQGESFDIQMRLSLEGIGALLQSDGEYVKVTSLVPGGPAERSGVLQPADRIVAVGQEGEEGMANVVGMRLDNVVELIRGPKGSVVKLDVVPAQAVDMTRSKVVKITRDKVELEDQAAQGEVIEVKRDDGVHRVGAITIPTFYVDFDAWQAGEEDYRSTTRDVAREIERLKQQDIEGIVLDLRGNGGGALQEANSLIGLFIDRGPTVQVRDARGRISLYGDTDSGTTYDGPLAVLVNRLSASASEIFAGAIQDYGRGLVLGTPTFGKGTVQTLNELSHGEIKMTRAKFYRISGDSTQLRGVTPDITFPSLVDPEQIGESSLDNALEWDTVRPVRYRTYGEPHRHLATLENRHQQRADELPNFRYLESRAELAKRMREQTTSVSLDREQREQEVEAQEAEQLALENRRREALGLAPLESWTDAREEEGTEGGPEEPVEQVQILESAHILLDFTQLNGEYHLAGSP